MCIRKAAVAATATFECASHRTYSAIRDALSSSGFDTIIFSSFCRPPPVYVRTIRWGRGDAPSNEKLGVDEWAARNPPNGPARNNRLSVGWSRSLGSLSHATAVSDDTTRHDVVFDGDTARYLPACLHRSRRTYVDPPYRV